MHRAINIFTIGFLSSILLFAATISQALESPTPSDNLRPQTLATNQYFTVKPDLRKCVSPFCGGYWISKVNKSRMRCPDGSIAKACYVWNLEFADSTDPEPDIANGIDLVRGSLEPTEFPFNPPATLYQLVVDAAYQPFYETKLSIRGINALIVNTGIVCITSPCPSLNITKLNTKRTANLLGFEFTPLFSDAEQEKVLEQMNDSGVLVFGNYLPQESDSIAITKFPGYRPNFLISNAYSPIFTSSSNTCGGLIGKICQSGQYCSFGPDCGQSDQTGTCKTIPEFCTDQYDPVCGCDGITYPNDCDAAANSVSVMHKGECNSAL